VLGGIGIQEKHANIYTDSDGNTVIKAMCEAATEHIYVNGQKLTSTVPKPLMSNDRIIFGVSSVFLFRHQDMDSKASIVDSPENPITYEFAMKEKLDADDAQEA